MSQQRVIRVVDWGDYEAFDPGIDRPIHEVSKQEAREAHKLLMAVIPDRLNQLRELLELNGVNADDLGAVDQWFWASVEDNGEGTGRLANIWYVVAHDLGIMLGERLIAETNGALRWEMVEAPKRDVSFQKSVIRGFDVPNPRAAREYTRQVAAYGHRIVGGGKAEGLFETLYAKALAIAPPAD